MTGRLPTLVRVLGNLHLSGAALDRWKWLSRKPVRLRQRRALPGTECLRALPW